MTTAQVQQPSEGSIGRRADFPMRGWRARFGRSTFGVALALVAIWAGFKTGATIDKTAVSLGLSGPVAPMPEPPPEPLATLPPATRQSLPEVASTSSVQAGTEGLTLPPPPALPADAACTLAIIGDLAPANAASEKYLQQTATQLNLLRPDAVFTIGNLVPGYSRSSQTYANEVLALRGILDTLKMPWFPCVGSSDVTSGTRDPDDHRFVTLYQKYFGPLYYSADCGNVHVIVLDSEAGEGAGQGNRISEAQLAWLKADLNKTFEGRAAPDAPRTQYVIVLLHRALWRIDAKDPSGPGNWDQVHKALVEFNRRPIVRVEGIDQGVGGGGGMARGRASSPFLPAERAPTRKTPRSMASIMWSSVPPPRASIRMPQLPCAISPSSSSMVPRNAGLGKSACIRRSSNWATRAPAEQRREISCHRTSSPLPSATFSTKSPPFPMKPLASRARSISRWEKKSACRTRTAACACC